MKERILVLLGLLLISVNLYSQNPNFHIYLCFGQSNMDGAAKIEEQDMSGVSRRFKVMQSVDCANLGRKKGNWYTAVPPLSRCSTGLSPADYFGRTMVANLPDSITIGVINVSVSGCNIGLFDKYNYQEYDSTYKDAWFQDMIAAYGGNPYAHLMSLAKLAQKDGVIKGILLHQGETNTGDTEWPSKVKAIYDNMLKDLSLPANSIPILAGELLSTEDACCSRMNSIINELPQTIPTAHVISSAGCTKQDPAHFDAAGYREIGRRYAAKILSLMGYKACTTNDKKRTASGKTSSKNKPK
jgi:hypothetical protein